MINKVLLEGQRITRSPQVKQHACGASFFLVLCHKILMFCKRVCSRSRGFPMHR
ncbi:cell division protein FtsQ [Vibrio cholerae]|nr:cell division protein FtsQ [Vibrio cholerae]